VNAHTLESHELGATNIYFYSSFDYLAMGAAQGRFILLVVHNICRHHKIKMHAHTKGDDVMLNFVGSENGEIR
jgi:hypothetical protein